MIGALQPSSKAKALAKRLNKKSWSATHERAANWPLLLSFGMQGSLGVRHFPNQAGDPV